MSKLIRFVFGLLAAIVVFAGFGSAKAQEDVDPSDLPARFAVIGVRVHDDISRHLEISIFEQNLVTGKFEIALRPKVRNVASWRPFNWKSARVGTRYFVHVVDIEHGQVMERRFTQTDQPHILAMQLIPRPTQTEQVLALRQELADLKVAKYEESLALQKQIGDLRVEADMERVGRLDREAQIRVLKDGLAIQQSQYAVLAFEKQELAKRYDAKEAERGAVADELIQTRVEVNAKDETITSLRRTISVFGPQTFTIIRDPALVNPSVYRAGATMARLGAWYIFPGANVDFHVDELMFSYQISYSMSMTNAQVWVNGKKYSSTSAILSGAQGTAFFDYAAAEPGTVLYVEFFGDIPGSNPGTYASPIGLAGWGTYGGGSNYLPSPVPGQDIIIY